MNILRFSLLLAASALSRPAAAEPADVTPTDRVYQLSVVTADGTEFDDCATFRENHDLVLLAGGGWQSTGSRRPAIPRAASSTQ
jgi:hypothetical protein